jgi:hypothetical protein
MPRPYVTHLLILLLVWAIPCPAQNPSHLPGDTLAEVGGGIIIAGDLFERIDLMPWQGKDRRRTFDSSRTRALESLVAERLLALEAAERGIGFDTLTLLRLRGLEREFVRDELYRRTVEDSVKISPLELRAGLKRYALILRIVVFRCPSRASAAELSQELRAATVFGRLPDSVQKPLSRDTVNVEFGIADESLEDRAYALDTAHTVSAPYHSDALGWAVLLLLERQTNPLYAQQDISRQLSSVREILRARKARIRGKERLRTLLGPQKAVADRYVLGLLARSMYAIIMSDSAAHKSRGRFLIAPDEIDLLEQDLRPHLGRDLVSMPGVPLSLGTAIQAFRIQPFSSPSLGRPAFLYVLNETVKRIVEEEFLAREGYRLGLQNAASVKHDLAAWGDAWRALMLEQSIPGGDPREEDEMQLLIENGGRLDPSYEVDVREILTDSLSEAYRLSDRLLDGADMADLARHASRRPGWSGRGGESGFFHVRSYPELGIRALAVDTGRLVGPVAVKGGYSLFRVLGKRGAASPGGMTLDSLRSLIRPVVRFETRRHVIDRFIAGLAQKYGVKMFFDRLQNVDLFRHNMVTRRLIGFGGMMNAAPVLKPEWGWVREYLRANHQIP